ncbi:MAG: tetratricopeptide repeat protein [Pseudomonadota bacterium]
MPKSRSHRPQKGVASKGAPNNPAYEARRKLDEAEQYRRSGKLSQARKLCEQVLRMHPDYVGALHTLGLILADQENYPEALFNLVQAEMLNPKDPTTLLALSGVYLRLGAREMAAHTLERAIERGGDEVATHSTLGEIYRDNREYELAAEAFQTALKLEPGLNEARMTLADCQFHLGQLEDAAKSLHALLDAWPKSIRPVHAISLLPVQLQKIDLQARIEAAENDGKDSETVFEANKLYTRAIHHHARGEHQQAWEDLSQANAPRFKLLAGEYHSEKAVQRRLLEVLKTTHSAKPAEEAGAGSHPISLFILGPSRSGKTTAERMLSSMPGVKLGYENPIVENAVKRTFQSAGLLTSDAIYRLPPVLNELFCKHYLEELDERAGQSAVFTNTAPAHIFGAMRIAQVVPGARFLFVKRDTYDVAFRILARNYRSGNSYAYDVRETWDYVTWYYQMIDLMVERFPTICRVTTYEEIQTAPGNVLETAAILCGVSKLPNVEPAPGDDRGCGAPYKEWIDEIVRS